MGNYADARDVKETNPYGNDKVAQAEALRKQGFTESEIRARTDIQNQQQKMQDALGNQVAPGDAYGGSTTQDIRKRGQTERVRVSSDTRARGADADGQPQNMGSALQTQQVDQQQAAPQANQMWQAQRQPTDLASVQARLLQSFRK